MVSNNNMKIPTYMYHLREEDNTEHSAKDGVDGIGVSLKIGIETH